MTWKKKSLFLINVFFPSLLFKGKTIVTGNKQPIGLNYPKNLGQAPNQNVTYVTAEKKTSIIERKETQ